jgi:hypothetical protein
MYLSLNTAICSSKYLQMAHCKSYKRSGMELIDYTVVRSYKAVASEGFTLDDNRAVFEGLEEGKYDSCALIRDWYWVDCGFFCANASC